MQCGRNDPAGAVEEDRPLVGLSDECAATTADQSYVQGSLL
jgi:hypothetical protein